MAKCKKHPNYKGIYKPRVVCYDCADYYISKNRRKR